MHLSLFMFLKIKSLISNQVQNKFCDVSTHPSTYLPQSTTNSVNNNFHWWNDTTIAIQITNESMRVIWDKVFKNGSSKICGRQSLKNGKGYRLLKQTLYLIF